MKKKLFRYIILFTLLSLTILCILFNAKIIHFLQQFKTTNTLLNYPKLWDEKIHDWLGDIITLVGVMLAFSLPFTAQVTQWTVNTSPCVRIVVTPNNQVKGGNKEQRCPDTVKRENKLY